MKNIAIVVLAALLVVAALAIFQSKQGIAVVFGETVVMEDLDANIEPPSRAFAKLVQDRFIIRMNNLLDLEVSQEKVREYLEQHGPELLDPEELDAARNQILTIANALEDVVRNKETSESAFTHYELDRYFTVESWTGFVARKGRPEVVNAMRASADEPHDVAIQENIALVEELYQLDMIRWGLCNLTTQDKQAENAPQDIDDMTDGERRYNCYRRSNSYVSNHLSQNVLVDDENFADYADFLTILVPLGNK